MNMKLTMLATAFSLVIAGPALAADSSYKAETEVKKDEDGSYKKTTTEKSAGESGSTSMETKTKVDVNKDGTVDKSVETESTNDPKGLMNKNTTKTKDSIKHKKDKTVLKHKKTVNGDTVEDSEKEVR
jgi:hypothetical protein